VDPVLNAPVSCTDACVLKLALVETLWVL